MTAQMFYELDDAKAAPGAPRAQEMSRQPAKQQPPAGLHQQQTGDAYSGAQFNQGQQWVGGVPQAIPAQTQAGQAAAQTQSGQAGQAQYPQTPYPSNITTS